MAPRHQAGVISRQTRSANLGPHVIHGTCGRCSDDAGKRGAAIAVAPHSSMFVIDKLARNSIEICIAFQ
jgi:hypothetical protein